MLKGIGSFIGMVLLLLAAGCMAGYIYGGYSGQHIGRLLGQ